MARSYLDRTACSHSAGQHSAHCTRTSLISSPGRTLEGTGWERFFTLFFAGRRRRRGGEWRGAGGEGGQRLGQGDRVSAGLSRRLNCHIVKRLPKPGPRLREDPLGNLVSGWWEKSDRRNKRPTKQASDELSNFFNKKKRPMKQATEERGTSYRGSDVLLERRL